MIPIVSQSIIEKHMLKHNLLLVIRNFRRHKTTFFINVIGLSTGLACCLLIYLWVNDEMAKDKFHENTDQLHIVMEKIEGMGVLDQTSGPVADILAQEMPEVEYAVPVAPPTWPGFDSFILTVNDRNVKSVGQYVGKDYFNIFSFELIQGDADKVLEDKNSIVISEDLALKLFKTTDVLGKTLELEHEHLFTISGIFKNISPSSSIQFDFALSFEKCEEVKPWVKDWNSVGPKVYVMLREGTDLHNFNQKIEGLVEKKTGGKEKTRHLFLAKYAEHYLYGEYENGIQTGGRIEYVQLFSIMALFVLFIACINFMNLSTAEASYRLKEVGVKKSFGASRKRIASQFFGESLIMVVISLINAFIIVLLILPEFNNITGKQLTLKPDFRILVSIIVIAIITMFMAGGYPSFYISGFNPITILKGRSETTLGGHQVRKGLVICQFTLSIILIVSVIVVSHQIDYIQNKPLGYNKDNVIYFEIEGQVKKNPELFLSELKKLPGIVNAASTTHDMVGHNWSVGLNWEGKDPDDKTKFQLMGVNFDFLETMGMEMKTGRFFSREFIADTTKTIINEAAAKAIEFEDPIGKKLSGIEIMGIVKNFHFKSFHDQIEPQVFILDQKSFAHPTMIMVRLDAGKEVETIKQLTKFYSGYNPGFPFDYTFLDYEYQIQYAAEQRVSTLSKYFAILTIIISCLGLFGLSIFTIQKKTREIGIRKILGSSDLGIIQLLSREFTKPVLTAIGIALPFGFFVTSKWLNEFAYRINLQWWYFLLAAILGLIIAWVTVGIQTFKASRINPADCLKVE